MVLRLKTRESRSLPGLQKRDDASRSLLHNFLKSRRVSRDGFFVFGLRPDGAHARPGAGAIGF